MPKKKHKKNIGTPKPAVRLSQCMIVKNEEDNIEQALSWGKGIVCEQIVVDTGSTDCTTEIAERIGAKVFHFEWINDFAAAKNYALEQAKGNWIAFLDADEYFPQDEAKKILPILKQVTENPGMREKYAIVCPMHQLDDDGKTMEVNAQARLFRNTPRVRYVGRIHEELNIGAPEIIRTEDIVIMHTGYSDSANIGKGKSMRNIEILRKELEYDPDNLRMKMYMADSLVSYANELLAGGKSAADEPVNIDEILAEAETLYKDVVYGDTSSIDDEYKRTSYRYLLRTYSKKLAEDTRNKDPEYDKMADNAYCENPDDFKITCYYAAILNNNGEYQRAFDILQKLEAKQSSATEHKFGYSIADMTLMCKEMALAAQGLGDMDNVFKYTSAILTADKTNKAMLGIYLKMLTSQLPSTDNVLEILGMMYDLGNADEAAFIAAVASRCGFSELAEKTEKRIQAI